MKTDAWGSQAFLIKELTDAAKLCKKHGYEQACLILLKRAVYLEFERIAAEEYFALSKPETLQTYFKGHEDMRLREIAAKVSQDLETEAIDGLFDDLAYLSAYPVD